LINEDIVLTGLGLPTFITGNSIADCTGNNFRLLIALKNKHQCL